MLKINRENFGDAGYRSRYLSHAKRALYHLSYTPCLQMSVLEVYLIIDSFFVLSGADPCEDGSL